MKYTKNLGLNLPESSDIVDINQISNNFEIIDQEMSSVSLEEDSEIIFVGGNAETSANVKLVIDDELSQISENAVQNKAITLGIKDAVQEVREELTIETGTSGIWQYEKWPNGILKCFAQKNVSVQPDTPWGDAYFYAPVDAIEFPDMFIDVPQLILSVEDSGANFLFTKRETKQTNTGTIYILAVEKITEEKSVRICMDAKGKWK